MVLDDQEAPVGLAQDFERRLERAVEGALAKAFRSGVEPIELARRLMREMGDKKMVDLGRVVVPNHYAVELSAEDRKRFASFEAQLTGELARTLTQKAAQEGWSLLGPVEVALETGEKRKTGTQAISATVLREAIEKRGALIAYDGQRIELSEPIRFGRGPDCDVILQDPNVSRHHAEIRWAGEGFELADLASTNGTFVNNKKVARQILREGDAIKMGQTTFRFVSN